MIRETNLVLDIYDAYYLSFTAEIFIWRGKNEIKKKQNFIYSNIL